MFLLVFSMFQLRQSPSVSFDRIIKDCSADSYGIIDDAVPALEYIPKLVSFEEKSYSTSSNKSVFDSVEDKIAQAALAFKNADYPAVLNQLAFSSPF
jgi:hypothetical protein